MTTQVLDLFVRTSTRTRSVQELRRARDVLRFGGMFALTVLGPALLLAYLSMSTIRSEELYLDAEYRSRATAMTNELAQEVNDIQHAFRLAVNTRLERGESPLDRLADLSPYLRGAYRFDKDGVLAAPFELDDDKVIPQPSARYRDLNRVALQHEMASRWTEAGTAFRDAAAAANHPVHEAEARLGEARSRARAGDQDAAAALLTELYSDPANVRESHGFRIGDLALLLRAEMRFSSSGDAAQSGLMDLVDRLLGDTWTVGELGEATVADTALGHLAGVGDQDWLARRRADLNERVAQIIWAAQIQSEIEIAASGSPTGQVRFLGANRDSPAIWATVGTERGVYAFSFSRAAIFEHLHTTMSRMNEREDALIATLLLEGEPLPDGAIRTAPMPDPMRIQWVSVTAVAPEQLANIALRRQVTRIAVVLVSIFLVGVGIWFSARTIGQEIENARAKADFAANVSHELRSPITQIRLKGEALQLGLTAPGQDTEDHYDAIVREAERLSRLVDNVLDFAAIERGAKKYHLRLDDMLSVVWSTVEANRNAIESRGLELELDVPDDLPPVWMDREAVGQILVNLMSNAAKYGQEGGWVGVSVQRGLHGVEVSVADRGIGIAETELDHIFDHFYRSSDSAVRRQKGTGIGLTIVSYIVEAHGGTISVESALGQGTTFTVTFPYEPPDGAGVQT